MSDTPTLTRSPGVYTLQWAVHQLEARVSRLKDSGQGVLSEVVLRSTLPASPGHLHHARLTLTSTTAKADLIKTLAKRLPDIPWDDVVEQLCVLVLKAHREGEPVLALDLLPETGPIVPLIAPLLYANEPTLLYGFGGSGKSMVAAYLGLLLAAGLEDERTRLHATPHQVLYLDYETDEHEVRRRLSAFLPGVGLTALPRLYYRRCAQPLATEVNDLQALIVEHQIDFLIVDSIGFASAGEFEKGDVAVGYFRALRQLGVSSLSLDHLAKSQTPGVAGTAFGSIYKMNCARSAWEIKKAEDNEDDALSVGLFHRKHNSGRLSAPVGLRFEFDGGHVIVRREDVRDIPDLEESLTIKERLIGALRNGKATVQELCEVLGAADGTIRKALQRHKDKVFTKIGDSWALLAKAKDEDVPV